MSFRVSVKILVVGVPRMEVAKTRLDHVASLLSCLGDKSTDSCSELGDGWTENNMGWDRK